MIQILPDNFTIEINSDNPVEDVYNLKMALYDVIEDVAISNENMNKSVFYLSEVTKLLKSMEYEPPQIEKGFKDVAWPEKDIKQNSPDNITVDGFIRDIIERNVGLERVVDLKSEIISQMQTQINSLEKRLKKEKEPVS